jgi:hypothetical protein
LINRGADSIRISGAEEEVSVFWLRGFGLTSYLTGYRGSGSLRLYIAKIPIRGKQTSTASEF